MASRVKIFPIARPGDDKSVNFPYSDPASKKVVAESDKYARAVRGAEISSPIVKNTGTKPAMSFPAPPRAPLCQPNPPAAPDSPRIWEKSSSSPGGFSS